MDFNSRAHVERDFRRAIQLFSLQFYFNSRAHVERDIRKTQRGYLEGNFNSRAHVERDRLARSVRDHVGISTHALTWSATRC